MFQKILLPLDLTDRHAAAVRNAAELAEQSNGVVIFLHVVELIPGLDRESERTFYDRLERRARDHLAHITSTLGRVQAHVQVIVGHRVQDTIRFSVEHKIDLIILTAPTFQQEHPASSLGSMAWKITLLAPCPVLLVKTDHKGVTP